MFLKACSIVVSTVLDICSIIGSLAFYKVVNRFSRFFYVAQLYRYLFLVISFLATLNSLLATKLILVISQFETMMSIFIDEEYPGSWLDIMFRISFACFYTITCMQILIVSILFVVKANDSFFNRKPGKFDYFLIFMVLLVSIAVGLPCLLEPLKLVHVNDEFSFPQPPSEFIMYSVFVLFACLFCWIITVLVNKDNVFSEILIVGLGMAAVVVNISLLYLGLTEGLAYLLEPAYIALPITSSFFSSSVMASRIITYPKVRTLVFDFVLCKQKVKVDPVVVNYEANTRNNREIITIKI
ncbi:hypothetical protein CRE_22329 [Caenorhabditis remanei]|uniref:Uncharacterized protein n=1 Tax=Caenorhabditis remanei TaxID=31234 RepID=E3ME61_CAERE|nr:hypothetical protein CRE_22329 [Caenorhabditis remanei]